MSPGIPTLPQTINVRAVGGSERLFLSMRYLMLFGVGLLLACGMPTAPPVPVAVRCTLTRDPAGVLVDTCSPVPSSEVP